MMASPFVISTPWFPERAGITTLRSGWWTVTGPIPTVALHDQYVVNTISDAGVGVNSYQDEGDLGGLSAFLGGAGSTLTSSISSFS